ncbi:hypothetical protein SZ54_2316 [Rhizobium sp. UR51a]|nr:hypothetical protein SZ54_2316 [Rhizobium sp. UR51a]
MTSSGHWRCASRLLRRVVRTSNVDSMEKLLVAHPWKLDHRSGSGCQCGGRTPVTSNRARPRLQGVRPAVIGLDALIRHTGLLAPYPLAELLADFLVLRMRRILPAAPPLVVEYGTEKCLSLRCLEGRDIKRTTCITFVYHSAH